MRILVAGVACVFVLALAACPPTRTTGAGGTGGGGGGGGGGAMAINPDACGTINTTDVGRKLYAFLTASAELDRASAELDGTIRDACKRMARELGVSDAGSTKDVCTRASQALDANLQVSVKSEKRLVTRYTPAVCHTNVDMTASFTAQCEASAAGSVDVRCEGRCGGTCTGACDGTCAAQGADGACAGQCNGTCRGRCTGECEGYADVHASAECEAAAEVHAGVHTECTEPKVEVVQQDVTVVDDSKFRMAVAAINAGLPDILRAEKKLELAGKALGTWVSTGGSLLASASDVAGQLGEKSLCVAGQLGAVVAAAADIQARFEVSVQVSVQVSASAGATAQ